MKTNTKPIFVAYTRVSTRGQGIGLEAQKHDIEAATADGEVIEWFTDKESGAKDEESREGLGEAIKLCQATGATLVVAKLDRLSRDLSDSSRICFKLGIKVLPLDMPAEAMNNPILFGVFAGLAQAEREKLRGRVKDAMFILKAVHLPAMAEFHAQGRDAEGEAYWMAHKSPRSRVSYADWVAKDFKLGTPHKFTEADAEAASKRRREDADNNKRNLAAKDIIEAYLADESNKRTLQAIADHLKSRHIMTPRGTADRPRYHNAKSVDLLCKRYGIKREKV